MDTKNVLGIAFALGFGIYGGIEGVKKINAGTQPFQSVDELQSAMEKDAARMFAKMRIAPETTIADPQVDAEARTISFDIIINDLEPTQAKGLLLAGMQGALKTLATPWKDVSCQSASKQKSSNFKKKSPR